VAVAVMMVTVRVHGFFLFFDPTIYRFNAIVESSALSREQKNKFPSSSSFPTAPALMCTHYMCCVLLFLCSVGFPAHERLGRVSWEKKKKKKKRSHKKSQQIPNFLPHRQTLSLSTLIYIYINISRPYPRAWRFFSSSSFSIYLVRIDVEARISFFSYFYGSTPLFRLFPSLQGTTLEGGCSTPTVADLPPLVFLRVVN
jgi:hypothetical protein